MLRPPDGARPVGSMRCDTPWWRSANAAAHIIGPAVLRRCPSAGASKPTLVSAKGTHDSAPRYTARTVGNSMRVQHDAWTGADAARNVINARVRDPGTREDLLQETVLRLHAVTRSRH